MKFETLQEYNNAYRLGEPLISDELYDESLEQYCNETNIDAREVASRLMDTPGKIKHKQVCGSLRKLKSDEPVDVNKWLRNINKTDGMYASAKVDGMSIVVDYVDGEYVKAITRGDGTYGQNQTYKCRSIVPLKFNNFTGSIRGELTLTYDTMDRLKELVPSKEHKNLRNSTAGIINQKDDDVSLEVCELIKFIAYEIIDSTEPREVQHEILSENFLVPLSYTTEYSPKLLDNLTWFLGVCVDTCPMYMVDGIVVHDTSWVSENTVYYPENARAFKRNKAGVETKITGIKFQLGKTGKLTPVADITPIDVDGSTISNVTLHNAGVIRDKGLGVGAIVTVIKSGDIIPKIISVLEPSIVPVVPVCPHCGAIGGLCESTSSSSAYYTCTNEECTGTEMHLVASFIKKCKIENVAHTTLNNFGIFSFSDLINFKPVKGLKRQEQLYNDIESIIMKLTYTEMVKYIPWNGVGETIMTKLIEFIGINDLMLYLLDKTKPTIYPVGVGAKTFNTILTGSERRLQWMYLITSDDRYSPVDKEVEVITCSQNLVGDSFCFSGKFDTPRKELEKLAIDHGGSIKSVSSNLVYFVKGDKCGPSKLAKVKNLMIDIISVERFMELVNR